MSKNRPRSESRKAPRRTFLKSASLAAAAGPTWIGNMGQAVAATTTRATLPKWVSQVRNEIPTTSESAYFLTGGIGPSPTPVIEKVKALLDLQNRGPGDPRINPRIAVVEEECRALAAAALGADEEEVTLTHNTTEGLNIVIWSIDWKAGDEILISNQEHPALLQPSYNLQDRFGVVYRRAPMDVGEDVLGSVLSQISPRTRLVAMSHVSRRNGRVLPAQKLARELRKRGVRLLLDGAQAAGNIPLDFHDLGCDYYSFCGHKWLLGPKGTGGLLTRKEILATTPVSWTGAHSQVTIEDDGEYEWHPDGRRYEFGTRALPVFGGFAETLRWLDKVGWDRIHTRTADLSKRFSEWVRDSRLFRLVSPIEDGSRSGVVTLRLPEGFLGMDFYERLAEKDGIVVAPLEHPRDIRVCVHFFNTWEEIDRLGVKLNEYCA